MEIIDRLLTRTIIDAQKQVIIPTIEMPIVTHRYEICVWWKRAYHRLPSHELPDGSQPVTIRDRSLLLPSLDPDRVLWAMSLYDEYDEMTDETYTYLYKFSKDAEHLTKSQQSVNRILPGYTIQKQRNFVQLLGDSIEYDAPDRMLVRLTHAGHRGLFSFMVGLILAYGAYDTEGSSLHTMQISLPLVGTIVERLYLVEHVVQGLRDIGIFMTMSKQDQRHGQVLQIMIRDRELLHMLVQYLGQDWGRQEASKYITQAEMKEQLLETIQDETSERKIREQVEYSVVKRLRK